MFKRICMAVLLPLATLTARELFPAGDFESSSIKPLHCRRFTNVNKKQNFKIPKDLVRERLQNEKVLHRQAVTPCRSRSQRLS